jgi:hypothetical protein
MTTWQGRISLWRRLLLGCGVLVSVSWCVPAPADAQVKRMEMVSIVPGSGIQHRGSNDGGSTWGDWQSVPAAVCGENRSLVFFGTPAIVSDQPGRLWLVARGARAVAGNQGEDLGLWATQKITALGSGWDCWQPLTDPGSIQIGSVIHNFAGSSPAISSLQPGQLDVFSVMRNRSTGALELAHSWIIVPLSYVWYGLGSNPWEILGTGNLQGAPAAVSWAPGRLDVFVRGFQGEIEHKWFDNWQWSSGWDNLGGFLTSSPTVASPGPGRLNIFARGGDGHLWSIYFAGAWSGWGDLGEFLPENSTPTATSRAPMTLDIFAFHYWTARQLSFDPNGGGWSPWRDAVGPIVSAQTSVTSWWP